MRSKDRLHDLHRRMSNGGVVLCTVEAAPAPPPHLAAIDTMFLEVESMRGWIHDMEGHTQLVARLHADPTFHGNKQLQEQLERAVSSCGAAGARVCGALRAFEAAHVAGARRNDVAARVARLQYAATRALYAAALTTHHAALDRLRDDRLRLLRRHVQLTELAVSDEECEALLESRDLSLFVDNVAAESAEARRALREAEARHAELARVEASLGDVRDLFRQLAMLVAAQQEQVDSVEYYALQATDHVELGQRQLLKGTVSRARADKSKMSVLLCLAVGFGVVLLVLLVT